MVNTKKKNASVITEREKQAPAYRKKIEEENNQLKKSLELTQDQASTLQQENVDIRSENTLLKERQRGAGLDHVLEVLYVLFIGAGIPYFIDKNYYGSSIALLIGVAIFLIQMIIRSLDNR